MAIVCCLPLPSKITKRADIHRGVPRGAPVLAHHLLAHHLLTHHLLTHYLYKIVGISEEGESEELSHRAHVGDTQLEVSRIMRIIALKVIKSLT